MRWGLIGASSIAETHMIGALRAEGQEIAAVASTSAARAAAFAAAQGIATATDDVARLLADPAIQAVYISSTNEKHHAQALAALEGLAGQLGLPGGLAGWAALARQAGGA